MKKLCEFDIERINKELKRQFDKFGNQKHKNVLQWNAIITEEFLEMEKAINESVFADVRSEAIQTIACLFQLIEKLDSIEYIGRQFNDIER